MPYTKKQKRLAGACKSGKGKMRTKCPPMDVVEEMLRAPVKKKRAKRARK